VFRLNLFRSPKVCGRGQKEYDDIS